MKSATTLTISGAVALTLGLAPLALAQSPPASTATPPATSQMTQPPATGTGMAATPSMPAVTASKAEIRQAQQALVKLGYNLSVDGMMGTQTRLALKKFQKANGIPETGRLDTDTKRALGLIGDQPPAGLDLDGSTTVTVPATAPAMTPSNAPPMSTSDMPIKKS